MNYNYEDRVLRICPEGRIDAAGTNELTEQMKRLLDAHPAERVELDLERVVYISSAGLRVILRLRQAVPNTALVNVSSEVYEILDVTGFTEIMEVRRAYRTVSVEGCEIVGCGVNGRVYRLSQDTVVKVYQNPQALEEMQRERELARTAFVLGVPTVIPYDVVKIQGGGYGSVYELLNATNFAKLLIRGERTLDEVARMSVELLKIIHGTTVNPDTTPSAREQALSWAEDLKRVLPAAQYEALRGLIAAVPEDNRLLHGDYHIRNITRQGEENLILDLDTLCHGHPIFELGSMYNAYRGFSELEPGAVERYLGIDLETAHAFWRRTLERYLDTEDDERIREVEDKAAVLGFTRLLRRRIRRGGFDSEQGRAEIERCQALLAERLSRVESLVF